MLRESIKRFFSDKATVIAVMMGCGLGTIITNQGPLDYIQVLAGGFVGGIGIEMLLLKRRKRSNNKGE